MDLNFNVAFAENGQKSDISEDKWLQGWVEIVGGINGVPTAQQFNQFGYVFDKKANIAYAKAVEAASDLTTKADKSDVESELNKKADAADLAYYYTKNAADKLLSDKADKSAIPTKLPADGGNAATVNGHKVNADVPANAKFTDTTYSNFVKSGSGAKSGLVPAPSTTAGTTKYLREDGSWQVPPNTTYSNMTAATASAAGKTGLVPAPAAGKQTSYLRGDGTWSVPTNTTYPVASASANGLVSTGTQTFAGNKTFNGQILANGATDVGTAQVRNLSTGSADATTTLCKSGAWYGKYE